MGKPLATQTSPVVAVDTHFVVVPLGVAFAVAPMPHPFSGQIVGGTAPTVLTGGLPTATMNSTAQNMSPHFPTPPGTAHVRPPTNQGTVMIGSPTVLVGGQMAARLGDQVLTCNDPVDVPAGTIVNGAPTVLVG